MDLDILLFQCNNNFQDNKKSRSKRKNIFRASGIRQFIINATQLSFPKDLSELKHHPHFNFIKKCVNLNIFFIIDNRKIKNIIQKAFVQYF